MGRLSHHRKVENNQREASGHGYSHRTRLPSDDSSLIMPVAPKPIKYNDSDARSRLAPKHVDSQMPSKRKRKRDEGRPSDVLRTVENYEKRKRYKTRADRYEAKTGQASESRRSDDRKKRSEKTKRSQAKKSSRRTGEDLARNFASSKVANERLTVSYMNMIMWLQVTIARFGLGPASSRMGRPHLQTRSTAVKRHRPSHDY